MKLETALRGSAFDHSFLHLKSQLDCLSRQPFCSKAFVVCMEFWLGLAVRYRLPRRKRVESPSLELVRNLLLGRPLRLDHLLFPFNRALQAGGCIRHAVRYSEVVPSARSSFLLTPSMDGPATAGRKLGGLQSIGHTAQLASFLECLRTSHAWR